MAAMGGDRRAALDRFLRQSELRAYRMALLAVREREAALDIVQDAMLKLVQNYAESEPELWPVLFYKIVESRICDWYRQQQRLRTRMAPEPAEAGGDVLDAVPAASHWQPEPRLQHHQAMLALDQALAGLSHRQRQAFLLRIWEGLDVAQTAVVMDCSTGSVKTHLSRAMAVLREALGEGYE